jgi:hypothetical protein
MEENQATPGSTKHLTKWERVTAQSTFVLALLGICTLVFAWIQVNAMRDGTKRQIDEMREEARGQINEMREEARVQHLTAMMDKYDSPAFLATRKSLAQQRVDQKSKPTRLLDLESDDVPYPVELDDELAFCDNIGLLTDRGYLDRHDVWYVFGQWLFYLREDARPYLASLSGPADYQKCTNLVDSIETIEKNENKGAYLHPSEDDRIDYYKGEMQRLAGQPGSHGRRPKGH